MLAIIRSFPFIFHVLFRGIAGRSDSYYTITVPEVLCVYIPGLRWDSLDALHTSCFRAGYYGSCQAADVPIVKLNPLNILTVKAEGEKELREVSFKFAFVEGSC